MVTSASVTRSRLLRTICIGLLAVVAGYGLVGCGYLTPTPTDALTPYVVFVTPTPTGAARTPNGSPAAGGLLPQLSTATPTNNTTPATATPPPPTPTIAASPTPETRLIYTVDPGDSFNSIAAQYNISGETLAAFNGLKITDTISPGQKLRIPKVTPSTPKP